MNLPPELEEQGMTAYEQARAFESLERRRLPLWYAGFCSVLWAVYAVAVAVMHRPVLDFVLLAVAVFFSVMCRANWMYNRARYEENLELLRDLRERFGEDLPWLRIERQVAMLAEIERENG